MPNIPNTVTSTAEGFQPAFARVPQNGDFDCAFACIASITGKPLAEVRELAVNRFKPVSYTHLDVYKRQPGDC